MTLPQHRTVSDSVPDSVSKALCRESLPFFDTQKLYSVSPEQPCLMLLIYSSTHNNPLFLKLS